MEILMVLLLRRTFNQNIIIDIMLIKLLMHVTINNIIFNKPKLFYKVIP